MAKRRHIFILGGGAAGLAAACVASEDPKTKVFVFEANERAGKKLLQTGNGRCNVSNRNISAQNYNDEEFFHIWNNVCPPEKVLKFLRDCGIRLSEDSEGRIYPATYSASSVLDALRFRCERNGVLWQRATEVREVLRRGETFFLLTADGFEYSGDKLIIATGSNAGGADINAQYIKSVEKTGHKFMPFSSLLAPLKTNVNLGALKNQRERAKITVGDVSVFGEVQFRADAISGIAVFEASFWLNKQTRSGKKINCLYLDFVPEMTKEELEAEIARRLAAGYTEENVLTGIVSNRVAQFVRHAPSLSSALKNSAFPLTGTYPTGDAQVCDGGFDTKQLNPDMSSRLVRDLFFAGECLNYAGNCGGYNLHAALAQGIIAGETV